MKHVVIAGASRCGKTTLSMKLSKLGMTHYKMDSIKRGIDGNFYDRVKEDWHIISPKVSHLISTIIEDSKTDIIYGKEWYVIDTCHLYPKDIANENLEDTIVIFIGHPNSDNNEKMKAVRKHDPKNQWTHKMSDEELIEYLDEGKEYSVEAYEECKKYGIPFFDVSNNHEKVIESIYEFIVKEIN